MTNSRIEKSGSDLVLESSLQGFFYDQLQEVNKKTVEPLPNETIYHSSLVMDKFGESENFFEMNEGKIREKILGIKLLETSQLTKEAKRRTLQDIGDTALFLCGYFSESLDRKLVDTRYYQEIGRMAYQRLNHLVPDAYDRPSFYQSLSITFAKVAMVMGLVSEKTLNKNQGEDSFLIMVKGLKAS